MSEKGIKQAKELLFNEFTGKPESAPIESGIVACGIILLDIAESLGKLIEAKLLCTSTYSNDALSGAYICNLPKNHLGVHRGTHSDGVTASWEYPS